MNRDDAHKSGQQQAPTHLSARALGEILDRGERAIRKRAQALGWSSIDVKVKGQAQKQFAISDLPDEDRKRVYVHFGILEPELADYLVGKENPKVIAAASREFDRATEGQRELVRARMEILRAWKEFRKPHKDRLRKGDDRFVEQYARREVVGLDPQVYKRVKKVSRSTLHEWQQRVQKDGIAGLISDKRHKLGKTSIPVEQQQFILGTAAHNPRWNGKRIATSLKAKFGNQAASPWAVGRFLAAKRALEPALFTFLDSPDKYKSTGRSKRRPYGGMIMSVDVQAIRERVNAAVERHGKGTAKRLAREAELGEGTLSQFRSGTYPGNDANVAQRLDLALRNEAALAAIKTGLYRPCWLVNTRHELRAVMKLETVEKLRQRYPDAHILQIWRGPEPTDIHFLAPE